MNISKRQFFTLIILSFGNILVGSTFAVLAPFYPAEAEKKGTSATEYGMVFGIYELINFLCSPLFGKYLHKLGPRLLLNLGLLIESVGCLFFGLLDNIDNHGWFISLSLNFRVIQALGASAYVTASFAVIAVEFPDSIAKTFAALETAYGLGLIAGPPIGGFLFEIGGFPLPFVAIGAGMFITVIVSCCSSLVLARSSPAQTQFEKSSGIFEFLKIPGAAIGALSVVSSGMSNSFMSTILEPHLRQFSLTPVQITQVFVLLLGTYAVCTPAWGWICDKCSVTNIISLAGSIIMLTGVMLIGPVSFLPFRPILWITCVGCALQGIGTGALNVSAFLQLMEWAKKSGFPDDLSTYGLTSGIWFSMISLGSFVGPIIAGILYDNVGFRTGSLFCVVEHSAMILLQTIFILWVGGKYRIERFRRNTSIQNHYDEIQPFLNKSMRHRAALYIEIVQGSTR